MKTDFDNLPNRAVNSLFNTVSELKHALTLNLPCSILNSVLTNLLDGPLCGSLKVSTILRNPSIIELCTCLICRDHNIKVSHLGAFCPYAIVYCYLKFKLRYLKNLTLLSIRVKELFKPIVLRKKADGFLLFLKAFSWETDLWVTVGNFTIKTKIWERKS